MNLNKSIKNRRSIRNFKQKEISIDLLKDFIDCARLAPSAANMQPLEYVVVTNSELREAIFQTTRWAGYISPDGTPKTGEKPVAFIIVLINNNREGQWGTARDVGAAVQNILLAAWSEEIGSCWIASADMDKVREILSIKDKYTIDSMIALGYRNQESCVVDMEDEIKYWKDEKGNMHVPKRPLENVIRICK